MKTAVLALLIAAGFAAAADTPAIRAVLKPAGERKPAPAFSLADSAGNTAQLSAYRGNVVLLDFWATWCTGCKQEIPWFAEFHRKYAGQGLAVVGVSLDDEGWKVLKPFLTEHPIPYRIVLGGDPTAHAYGIQNMPDTFLIDRQGRLAASYLGGIVDRADVEANIQKLLAGR